MTEIPATNALAFVLLESAVPIEAGALAAELRAAAPGLPHPTDWKSGGPGILTATIPGGGIAVAPMPIAVPAGDLEAPLAWAWHWPAARDAVARHRAHLVVHAASTALAPLDLRLLHTKLVGATLALAGARAVGVYVGHASLLRSADDYRSDAAGASRDELPLLAWLGFVAVPAGDGRISAFTTGMEEFGFLDIEVRRTRQAPPEVLGFLADAASYQLTSGRRLADGDTFGFSADDRRPIRHERSEFRPGKTVVVIAPPA